MTTWNLQDKTAKMTVAGLKATASGGGQWVRAKGFRTAGKWFFSIKLDAKPVNPVVGFSNGGEVGNHVGANSNAFGVFANGYGALNGSYPLWGQKFAIGNVIDLAYDSFAGRFWYRVNGRLWNDNASADPATGRGGHNVAAMHLLTVTPIFGGNSKDSCTANFGPDHIYAPPAGFATFSAPAEPEAPPSLPPAEPNPPVNGRKIGIGCWEDAHSTTLRFVEQMKFAFYYNWRPDRLLDTTGTVRSVPFVPMIWGTKHLGSTIDSGARELLGFNEPDGPDMSHQSNMKVDQAISQWPHLVATGLRLGSPATQQHNTFGEGRWQTEFMARANALGYRVDFMAVHYYSVNGSVADFESWLRHVYATYGLPVWITEWCLVDWARPTRFSFEENASFARSAFTMLESLPFVERHAWFSANPYDLFGAATNLIGKDGALTAVGKTFQEFTTATA